VEINSTHYDFIGVGRLIPKEFQPAESNKPEKEEKQASASLSDKSTTVP
jgi:hypothetical protein